VPDIELVTEAISIERLRRLAESTFGDFVKAVVDIGRGVLAVGGELHADAEATLLDDGSEQADIWGINLYPGAYPAEDWIEFDSMINVRPRQANQTRGVEDHDRRQAIRATVERLVIR
jgi:hypothetical protein